MASLENKYGKSAVDATRRNALPPYLDTLFEGGIVNKTDIATTSALGLVKPDGDTVTIDADGTIHSQSSGFGGIEMHGVDLAANAWSNKTQTVTISTYAIATSDFLSVPQIETSSEYSASGVVLSSATVNVSTHTASLVFSCTTVPTATVSTTVLVSTSAMETGIALADAIANYPKIQNGKWYVWNVSTKQWVDTGVKAGITSIVQTTTSTADGGTNVVTATLSDGTKTTFNIKNGQKGSAGAKGDTGTAAGFANPTATATTLSPGSAAAASVTASGGNTMKQFDFSFGIPQGEKGDKGDKGDTGAAAGFGTPTASATTIAAGSSATASVTASGSNTSKVFAFTFGIPKGEKGEKGAKGDTGATGATGAAAGFGTPTATANTLAAGSNATVSVTASGSNTSKVFAFTFGIPKGEKGAKGDTGATGPTGPTGPAGSSIQSIARTSGTGEAGSTDTYTITLTNGNTTTFQVKNGNDGKGLAMRKATLTANGWRNNSQTVQISASASAASDFLSIPEAETNDIYAGAGVKMTSVSINEGTVDCTFTCTTTPTADVDTVILVSTSNESIEEYLNGIVDDMTDLYNQTEADFNTASGLYVKKAGDTMTGPLTLKGEQYNGNYGLNANNSDIVRVNRVAFSDRADNANEGIDFYRDSTHWDTIWAQDGTLLFTPNRSNNATTSAADSQKIARFPSTETADRVVFSNDANGGLKTPYANTDATNLLLNSLSTGTSTPTDNDYYISQYVGGGTTTTTYHRRPASALWEYIKSKISSVLGLTASNYSGTASQATADGSGNNIVNTYATKTALDNKVDKVTGKGLSANDFTNTLLSKLNGIESGAQVNTVTGVKGSAETSYRTGNINITKANIGLGNVDNTSDANKPISTATQTALDNKVDKVTGKGLSTNDFTTTEKNKLSGIESGAQVNTITGVKGDAESSYRTGNVNVTKANVGLGNVDNTKQMPISGGTFTNLDNVFFTASVGSVLMGSQTKSILNSPEAKYIWHDVWAFCRAQTPTYEVTTNGSTWTSATLEKRLFAHQNAWGRSTILTSTQTGVRWTWANGGFGYSSAPWLAIGVTYTNPVATFDVKLESSADSFATSTVLLNKQGISANQVPIFIRTNESSQNGLRLTITKNSGASSESTLAICSLMLLSYRWGDQGKGEEYEHPYTWDANYNLSPLSGASFVGNLTGTASKATADASGNNIKTTYLNGGSISVTPSTTTVNSITAVGSLSSLTFTPNSTSKNMTIAWNAGTLPTKGANTTVATGISSATFTGTHPS